MDLHLWGVFYIWKEGCACGRCFSGLTVVNVKKVVLYFIKEGQVQGLRKCSDNGGYCGDLLPTFA